MFIEMFWIHIEQLIWHFFNKRNGVLLRSNIHFHSKEKEMQITSILKIKGDIPAHALFL